MSRLLKDQMTQRPPPPATTAVAALRTAAADGDDLVGHGPRPDHDAVGDDTDRVPAGNTDAMPASALLALWPHLPALRLVVELGGVRAAASALGVQAPAVSKSLRQLETLLGEPLFHRVGRSLVATDKAHALQQAVRDAMRHVDDVVTAGADNVVIAHAALLGAVVDGLPVSSSQTTPAAAVTLQGWPGTEAAVQAVACGRAVCAVGVDDVVAAAGVVIVDVGMCDEVQVAAGVDAAVLDVDDVSAAVAGYHRGFCVWLPLPTALALGISVNGVPRRRRRRWLAHRDGPMPAVAAAILRVLQGG